VANVEIAHDEGMLRIATFRNVQINVWTDAPDVAAMRAFSRVAQAFCQARPKSTALLNAVISGTPRFSEGVRDEVVKAMKIRGAFRLGAAHVIAVGGLPGTATRAFLSTAILLGRPKTPTKVFGQAKEACEWISERAARPPEHWTVTELIDAYNAALAHKK
jgi:hypothetical protein